MKVQGNAYPETITVEPRIDMTGIVEIRIRENINDVSYIDQETGQNITMYEYDEYTFILPDRDGLREDIEANMVDWLATGRTLEVNSNASIVADQHRDINAYEAALSEIETALGVRA